MSTFVTVGILFALDAGTRVLHYVRRVLGIAAPILIVSTCFLIGTAARAQNGGYMRAMTPSRQIAGESTNAQYNGWIILRQATLPSASEIAAMADESKASADGAAKAVHRPVVVVKDRDRSSLALLGAMTSKQHLPEIDIVLTGVGDQVTARYKLTDATIISIRASGTDEGTQEPVEQVRISYAKIEVQ